MLLTIAIILFVLWLLGLIAFHFTAGLLWLILIIAIIIFLYDLLVGRRRR